MSMQMWGELVVNISETHRWNSPTCQQSKFTIQLSIQLSLWENLETLVFLKATRSVIKLCFANHGFHGCENLISTARQANMAVEGVFSKATSVTNRAWQLLGVITQMMNEILPLNWDNHDQV